MSVSDEITQEINRILSDLMDNSIELPERIQKVLDEKAWDLYTPAREPEHIDIPETLYDDEE